MIESRSAAGPEGLSARSPAAVTVFVCANCARPGQTPTSAGRRRPTVPDFHWPFSAREVLVSCAGRLQPEHVLKAFETGSDAVCAVGCQEENCHHLEGSKRCSRRVDYVRSILQEIGLGGERLMFFTLPGTAAEDLALGAGMDAPADPAPSLSARIAAVRDQVIATVERLPQSSLHRAPVDEAAEDPLQEVDDSDENEED